MFGQNDGWKRLRTLVKELSAAFALAVPRPETAAITPHLTFFQRVVAMIRKRLADDNGGGAGHARQCDIDAAVRQLIGGAVDADEVIDLFAVAGLAEARLDILSDEFLGRVTALKRMLKESQNGGALLSAAQAARRAKVGTEKLYTALTEGSLPAVRRPGRGGRMCWNVRSGDLDVWTQRQDAKECPEPATASETGRAGVTLGKSWEAKRAARA